MSRQRRWTHADVVAFSRDRPVPSQSTSPDPFIAHPPRSKYGNQSVTVDGRRFDSKLEARYAQELDLRWKAGDILWYTTQVPFRLEGGIVYRADFLIVNPPYLEHLDAVTVVDCKGFITQTSRNKMRQVEDRYSVIVQIYRADGSLTPYSNLLATRRKPNHVPS